MKQPVFVRRTCFFIPTNPGDCWMEPLGPAGWFPVPLTKKASRSAWSLAWPRWGLYLWAVVPVLNRQRYRGLGASLRGAGFEQDVNDQGNERLQTCATGTSHTVTVDLLVAPIDKAGEGDAIPQIESGLAAAVTPDLELAFGDRCLRVARSHLYEVEWATRVIPLSALVSVPGPICLSRGTNQKAETPTISCTLASRLFTCGRRAGQKTGKAGLLEGWQGEYFQFGGDTWIPGPARRTRAKEKGRGGLMPQPRPQANRKLNPRWRTSIIMKTTPGCNRLRMLSLATSLAILVGGRLHIPRTVPQKFQEAFTMIAGGSQELRSRGRNSLSWSESTTMDAWSSGPMTCSLAGGRSPNSWAMTRALEREGSSFLGLRLDRPASLLRPFPQSEKNLRFHIDPARVPLRSQPPQPVYLTCPKSQETD